MRAFFQLSIGMSGPQSDDRARAGRDRIRIWRVWYRWGMGTEMVAGATSNGGGATARCGRDGFSSVPRSAALGGGVDREGESLFGCAFVDIHVLLSYNTFEI